MPGNESRAIGHQDVHLRRSTAPVCVVLALSDEQAERDAHLEEVRRDKHCNAVCQREGGGCWASTGFGVQQQPPEHFEVAMDGDFCDFILFDVL